MLIGKIFILILLLSILVSVVFFGLKVLEANINMYKKRENKHEMAYLLAIPASVFSAYLIYVVGGAAVNILMHENIIKALFI